MEIEIMALLTLFVTMLFASISASLLLTRMTMTRISETEDKMHDRVDSCENTITKVTDCINDIKKTIGEFKLDVAKDVKDIAVSVGRLEEVVKK